MYTRQQKHHLKAIRLIIRRLPRPPLHLQHLLNTQAKHRLLPDSKLNSKIEVIYLNQNLLLQTFRTYQDSNKWLKLLVVDKLRGLAANLPDHSSNNKQTHLCVIICRIGAVRQTIKLEPDQAQLLRIITITITSDKWKNVKRRKRMLEHSK